MSVSMAASSSAECDAQRDALPMLSAIAGFGISHKPLLKRAAADEVADKAQLIDVLPLPESFMQGVLKAAAFDAFKVPAHEDKQPQSRQETECNDWRGGVEKQPSKKKLDFSRLQPQSQAALQHLLDAPNNGVDPGFVVDAIGAFLLLSPPMMISAPLPPLAKPPPQSRPLATFFGTPSSGSLFPLSPPATMAAPEHQLSLMSPKPRPDLPAFVATAVKRTAPRAAPCEPPRPPPCVAPRPRPRTPPLRAKSCGKQCIVYGCDKHGKGPSRRCIAHGGGRRCEVNGCTKSAQGASNRCKAHGGGKRCLIDGCTKSSRGASNKCIAHGGGKRCLIDGCGKAAQGRTKRCKAHRTAPDGFVIHSAAIAPSPIT